jgi:predicted thioesterase
MNELKPGLSAAVEWTVDYSMTAAACSSGLLPVFSTPMLVALMECAACKVIEDALPEGGTSVGVEISVRHTAASPVGAVVRAQAVLTEADGKRLSFEINAFDENGPIGAAVHKPR